MTIDGIDYRNWVCRVARLLAPALCLVLLSSCNLLNIGYGHLDTYAAWTADEYFDLDAQQKLEFHARFDRLHEWHRYEQLPDYAAFLTTVKARVQKGLTREDALWIAESLQARYRALVKRGAVDAAALLMTVTPAQLEALQRKWEKDNRRFVRKYNLEDGANEQRRAAAKHVLARIRDWTGGLSDEQERRIAVMVAEMPAIHRLRHEDRLRRQREFLHLMTQRGDRMPFTETLPSWLLNWEEGRNPEFDRLWKQWLPKQADLYVAVDRMLTPNQREHVMRRLQNYADDFTRLSRRPAAQATTAR
jgi:hypothetical protein